uniref:Uncharacterized protein n=1 Tax=Arundo donax TaxID=35708 RepID=A0A0A9H1A6_ARUDO
MALDMGYGKTLNGHDSENDLRCSFIMAAEAFYSLQEAVVEVGGPSHPGHLGSDVLPHVAIPAAAAHL